MFRILVCSLLLGFSACMGEPTPQAAEVDGRGPPKCTRERVQYDSRTFLAFFDRGSDDLTQRARTIIAEVASYWLENGGWVLTVVGHTDASEAESKDSDLGARRARAAAAYLAEMGIPANRISAVNVGASQPLVQTPRGAREPQNRFVGFSISLDGGPKAADSMYQRALCIEWLQKTYCDRSATNAEARACSNAIRSY